MIELPYLLKHENICRLEGGNILIGDRRVFRPSKDSSHT